MSWVLLSPGRDLMGGDIYGWFALIIAIAAAAILAALIISNGSDDEP